MEFFNEENILLDVDVQDKLSLFQYISDYATRHEIAEDNDKDRLVNAFLKREDEYSTGLQDSFAIPHAKADFISKPTVIFLKLKNPVEWETFDGAPVSNVFALLVPQEFQGNLHLKMISNIATVLMESDFTETVKNTKDIQLLKNVITKAMNA